MKFPITALCVLLSSLVSVSAQTSTAMLSPEDELRFKAAADYSKAARGVAMLIMRDGVVIFEDYAPIWNESKPHLLGSATKSFVAVIAACAVQDRLIALDEKVSDTLEEWKDGDRKEKITIRQLLNLSSGIEGGDNPTAAPVFQKAVDTANAAAEPGTIFSYGPIPFQCFGALMSRKLQPKNDTLYEYLDRRVLAPIGLRVGFWRRDSKDEMNMPTGAFLTAREWAKFGELVRQRGLWEKRQVVSPRVISQLLQPSPTNPAYACGWWLLGVDEEATVMAAENRGPERQRREIEDRKTLGFHIPRDTLAAIGKGGQGCYIIPSQKLVIVRLGDSEQREFSDNRFIAKVLGKELVKRIARVK